MIPCSLPKSSVYTSVSGAAHARSAPSLLPQLPIYGSACHPQQHSAAGPLGTRINHGDDLTLGSCSADRASACPRSRAGTQGTSSRSPRPGDIPGTTGMTPGTTPRDSGDDPGDNPQRQPSGTKGVTPGIMPRDKRVPPVPAGRPHPHSILPHRPIASPGSSGVGGAEPFVRQQRHGGHPRTPRQRSPAVQLQLQQRLGPLRAAVQAPHGRAGVSGGEHRSTIAAPRAAPPRARSPQPPPAGQGSGQSARVGGRDCRGKRGCEGSLHSSSPHTPHPARGLIGAAPAGTVLQGLRSHPLPCPGASRCGSSGHGAPRAPLTVPRSLSNQAPAGTVL